MLSYDAVVSGSVTFSPDSQQLAYIAERNGQQGETWEPQFRASDVTRSLVQLYTIAVEVLQGQPR